MDADGMLDAGWEPIESFHRVSNRFSARRRTFGARRERRRRGWMRGEPRQIAAGKRPACLGGAAFVPGSDPRSCTVIRGAEHGEPRFGGAVSGATIADPR